MNNLVFNCLGVGQDQVFPQNSSLIKFISHIFIGIIAMRKPNQDQICDDFKKLVIQR